MAEAKKVHIIGIGDDGLDGVTEAARRLIEQADLLIGSEQTINLVGPIAGEQMDVGSRLDDVVDRIASSPDRRIVVLATGDPLFYGTARYLCTKLGKERFDVLPHVSAMQMAFARVKESWEEAFLTDLSRWPLASVIEKARIAEKVGLFTSEECPPSAVARALLESHIDYFYAYVCENLGSPDERVTQDVGIVC